MERALLEPGQRASAYDPYACPASPALALQHRAASLVGIRPPPAEAQLCPCCKGVCNKAPLSPCFQEEEIVALGTGLPMYFVFSKYLLGLLLASSVLTGGFMSAYQAVSCKEACLRIYGIPILDLENVGETAEKVEWLNIVNSVVVLAVSLWARRQLTARLLTLDASYLSIKHYSLLLQNLPPDMTADLLASWFERTFKAKVV
jgi:hypothetical protein